MAQIETLSFIDSISGKLDKNEQIVFRTRNGKKTAYILHKSERQATETQNNYREIFRQASANAKADMANPKKLSQWKKVVADPENKYTVPYMWSTVGILYDSSKVKEEVTDMSVM